MFETAELGRSLPKGEFKKREPLLRDELLRLQDRLLHERSFSTLLVFAGVDGAGKGETVGLLNAWMDPRWLTTRAYDGETEEERERPDFWKYWRDVPPRGRIAMFMSAWYSNVVLDAVHERIDGLELEKRLERIIMFERTLANNRAVIHKFWMHLSHDAQEKRLRNLENNPLTRARVTERDWHHWRLYDRFIRTAERVISHTNRSFAPWTIVEGVDAPYRSITVASIVRDLLEKHLDEDDVHANNGAVNHAKASTGKKAKKAKKTRAAAVPITVLSRLDTCKTVKKADYAEEVVALQADLHKLHLRAKAQKTSTILIFEGPDAAGKGGAIRRLAQALDVRNYQVHGIAAPTDEEKARHYLWRFWRRLPRGGHIAIFDRSWYGRVLVERVEGFASEDEWRRAYAEINDFEDQLDERGIVLVKYWIHITQEEQLKRFKLREKTSYKSWKLTDEDWRNRGKWHDYDQAVHDLVQYTSTFKAPWTLVEGNDKRFARLKVLRTLRDRLAERVGPADPVADGNSNASNGGDEEA